MFLELIEKRRSIRRYADQPVEAQKVALLVEAAVRAPSSRSLNPWEFIVVTDRDMLAKLSRAKPHGAAFLKGAALGFVVCADPQRCDVWIEDAAIASIFVHLAAASLGLGSCWIQIRDRMYDEHRSSRAYVAELLGLPEGREVESIVAIGYPAEQKNPHPQADLPYERVFRDRYGVPWR